MLVGGDGAAALAFAARIDHDAGVAMRGGQQHLLPVLGWIGVDGEQHGRRQGYRCGARAGQLRRQHDAIANGDAQCVVDGEAALLFRRDQRRGQGSGQGLRTQYRPQAQQFQGDGLGMVVAPACAAMACSSWARTGAGSTESAAPACTAATSSRAAKVAWKARA
jgi:hypothetical protein